MGLIFLLIIFMSIPMMRFPMSTVIFLVPASVIWCVAWFGLKRRSSELIKIPHDDREKYIIYQENEKKPRFLLRLCTLVIGICITFWSGFSLAIWLKRIEPGLIISSFMMSILVSTVMGKRQKGFIAGLVFPLIYWGILVFAYMIFWAVADKWSLLDKFIFVLFSIVAPVLVAFLGGKFGEWLHKKITFYSPYLNTGGKI